MPDFSDFSFTVAPDVFDRFPEYVVGCLFVDGIHNDEANETVDTLLEAAESAVREQFAGREPREILNLAIWRDTFGACGWTPSKYPSSIEALVKRVLRGDALPRINPVVDLINAAALLHLVPIGAHDLDTLPANSLDVRPATENDVFVPMGSGDVERPDPGEIIYASGSSVRTRRWVWRQSREALVSSATTRVFIPIDGFSASTERCVHSAMDYLESAISSQFGASVSRGFVSIRHPLFLATT